MLSKEVSVLDNVGQGKYENADGSPCCAVGWYFHDHPEQFLRVDYAKFFSAYREAFNYYQGTDLEGNSVEHMNDSIVGGEERAKIYNLANAILGYTEGQSKETLKALKEIENVAS